MEQNEVAQYIQRPKYPGPGFAYKRTFDISKKDFSLKHVLQKIGFPSVSVEVLTKDTDGTSDFTVAFKQGNDKDPANHQAVASLGSLGTLGGNIHSFDLQNTVQSAYISFDISGTLGATGEFTVYITAGH